MSADVCRWLILLAVTFLFYVDKTNSKEIRVVCYYTNWSVYRPGAAKFSPQNINPYLCTHLVYAFGGFTKENTLKPFDKYQDIEKGGYAKFTGLKTYNKNLKTLLAIGGWNEGSSRFSPMVANSERRKELVKNTIKFLRQNHFDGLDLDWEYPSFRDGGKPHDRENYAQLVQELREEFERESEKTGRTRLLLTMAVPAGIEYINKGYDVPKLMKYLDWMNILSYDYHSAFEPAVNHHAPLYSLEEDSEYNYDGELNIDYTIKHYLKLGADPNKLVLGIPTYGRSYTLFNPDANEIGAPADGPGDMGEATRENGYLAYYEICENIKNQDWEVVQPNPTVMGPYAYKNNQWVGYDDDQIARRKAEYVAENNLGGVMFWSIDNDDFRGNCHGKPYPIIEAAKEALISAYGLTEENSVQPTSKTIKSKTRTRPSNRKTTTAEPEKKEVIVPNRRRNRIKPKSSSSSRVKSRKETQVTTTEGKVYSSLELITPSYTTPAPPTTPDQGGSFKCEDEGFYPHPKDCKKYYWCLSGPGEFGIIAHQFTCPAGLYFNKAADSCDYTQNVLCNKKLTKPTTTTSTTTTTTTTEKPAKARVTFRSTTSTTTTTEAPFEDEYEYEDDVEDEENNDSEDPKVIKELLDLIKKAGGIEQLEKQLKIHEDGSVSVQSSDTTTPSSISKNLVQRVLNNAARSNINRNKINPKYNVINRNSRGPQNAGLETEVEESEKTRRNNKLTYTTITRQRSTKTDTNDDQDDDDDANNEEDVKDETTKKTKYPEYVNIRRGRVTSTTEETENDFKFSRNKILGEETDDQVDEDGEEVEDGEDKKSRRRPSTPQYVNIRRQRPSTTEETSTSKYTAIRRSTTTETPEEDNINGTNQSKRRGTTVAPKEENSKYQTIRRGSTTESVVKEISTEKQELRAKDPEKEVATGTETSEIIAITTSPENINIQTISNIGVTNVDDEINQTTPLILEPRPFSLSSLSLSSSSTPIPLSTLTSSSSTPQLPSSTTPITEITSRVTKVSVNHFKKPIRHKETSTLSTPSSRTRSRLTTPASVATTPTIKTTIRPTIQRSRKRFTTTTTTTTESLSYDEYDLNRTYRPSEIADLSSLTAVDFGVVKDLNRISNPRSRRVRPSSTTTTTEKPEESLKTSSRTIPLARKLIENGQFGNSRRILPKTTEDQINSSTDVKSTQRIRAFTRTTPLTESTTETTKSTLRSRKIIRRLRPVTSTESSINNEQKSNNYFLGKRRLSRTSVLPSSTTEKVTESVSTTTTTTRKPIVDIENDTEINDVDSNDNSDEDITEEGENFKLSESNIRENNDINSSNIIQFIGEKTGKTSKGIKSKNEDDFKIRSTTEPPIIIRTRKIIRKLKPTEPTPIITTSTTESTIANNRRRKIIRRLRPTTETSNVTEPTIHIRGRPFRKQTSNETNTKSVDEKKFTQSKFNILEKDRKTEEYSDEIQKTKKLLLNRSKTKLQLPINSTTENIRRIPIDRSRYSTINRSTTLAPKITELVEPNEENNNEQKITESSLNLDNLDNETMTTTEYTFSVTNLNSTSTTEVNINDAENVTNELSLTDTTTELFQTTIIPITTAIGSDDENNSTTDNLENNQDITETTTTATTTTTTPKPYVNPILAKQKHRPAFRRPKLTTQAPVSTTVRNTYRSRLKGTSTTTSTTITTTTTTPKTTTTTTIIPEITTIELGENSEIIQTTEETSIVDTTPFVSFTEIQQTTTENNSPTILKTSPTTIRTTVEDIDVTTLNPEISTITGIETTESPEITLKSTTTEKITTTNGKNDETTTENNADDLNTIFTTESSQATIISSSTTESVPEIVKESTIKKISTTKPPRIFRPHFTRTSLKPNFRITTSTTPLRNRFLYRYSTTERNHEQDHIDEEDEEEPAPKFTSPSVRNRLLYKYSTTEKYREQKEIDETDEKFENEENVEDEKQGEDDVNNEEITQIKPATPLLIRPTQRSVNKPNGFFRKTTEKPKVTEDLSGINTEAVKNRNKNLFSQKRKMNTPFAGSLTSPATITTNATTTTTTESIETSIATETTPIVEATTKPSAIDTTTEFLTTLHHVFAEPQTTEATSSTENLSKTTTQSRVEKLIEVNRIIEVHADKEMENSTNSDEKMKILDKIGAVNRVTVIKIIDPDENEIKQNTSNNLVENQQIHQDIVQSGEIAKVEEIPNPQTNRNDRKYELFSNKNLNFNDNNNDKPLIIDGISNINIITPRPYFNTEASTISLEGLFQTDNPQKRFTNIDNLTQKNHDEEILDTEHSQFIKVRVLNDDDSNNNNNNNREKSGDYITMKAEVVEVTPTYPHETIKIVPIQLEMTKRRLINSNTDFLTTIEEGVPKVDIKLIQPEKIN